MLRTLRLLVLLVVATSLLAPPARATAEPAVALSGTELTFFDTATPTTFLTRAVAGLPAGPVEAMDIRPVDGQLYVITMTDPGGADNTVGQLWRIDLATAVATQVGTPFSSALTDSAFWGMDFNPVADRIRLVENDNDQYRVNPTNGTLTAQDADLSSTDIGDVAYDRNALGGTATTAFAVNFTSDRLLRLGGVDGAPSPNTGLLTDIGALGVGIDNTATFDISPSSGIAYLTQGANVYTVDLATGAATLLMTLTFNATNGVALLGTSTIQVGAAAVAATEAAGTATVTATRTGVTNVAATVDFATTAGTATAGTDYASVTGTLTFAPGETSKTIEVPIVQDTAVDTGETFTVTLSNVTGRASAGAALTSTVTIADEDVADTARPAVLALPLRARSFGSLVRSGARTAFSISEASTTRTSIRLGTRVVGSALPRTAPRARIDAVTPRLSRTGRQAVASALRASRTGRVVLVVRLVTRDLAGNTRTTNVRLVVTR